MKTRSENYVMTVDPKSTSEMAQLASIRDTVKNLNKINKEANRVVVRGRLGKNNPEAGKYSISKYRKNIVNIALADAVRYDVYIYKI